MQEFRHARLDGLAGLQEVATHEEVGFTRLCAGEQRELGGSLGVLPPQLRNPVVRRLPFRNRRAPVAEYGLGLGRRAPLPRDFDERTHACGERIGGRSRVRGDRETEAAEVIALVVIAVPAAVILHEIEGQDGPLGIGDRRLGRKHGVARLVTQPGTGIDPPGGLGLAVDGVLDRARQPALPAPVVEDGLERFLRLREVRRGTAELDRRHLVRRVGRGGLHLELRQSAAPGHGAAWTAQREVWIGEELQSEGRNCGHLCLDGQLYAVLRGRIALREKRAVLKREVLLAAG